MRCAIRPSHRINESNMKELAGIFIWAEDATGAEKFAKTVSITATRWTLGQVTGAVCMSLHTISVIVALIAA